MHDVGGGYGDGAHSVGRHGGNSGRGIMRERMCRAEGVKGKFAGNGSVLEEHK